MGWICLHLQKLSQKKENLRGRVPVQVKGTENNDLSKSEISFQVSLVDLNNYLYDGGVMFFVVYIAQNGLAKQIYYAALPPVKLRVIISEASGQKSKNIKLKKFPTDSNQKAIMLVNCLENCQKQSSFTSAKLLSLEELEEQGVLENVSISLPVIEGISPHSTLFSTEIYLYANIKGSSIPQPIEAIPSSLTAVEEKKQKSQ